MNSPASFLRSLIVFGSRAALFLERLHDLRVELGERRKAARGLFRIRAGLERFLFLALGAFLVVAFFGLRPSFGGQLRIDRLGDHVGRVRVDEADDDVDQAALADFSGS
jgi:hypothetical protein